jgi:hypothetical protein
MEQYRQVIVKALQKAQGLTPERQADMILAYIDIASSLLGPVSDIGPPPERRDIEVPIIGGRMDRAVQSARHPADPEGVASSMLGNAPEPPAPRRVTGKPDGPDTQYHAIEDLLQHVNQYAPPTIDVALADGSQIRLVRKINQQSFSEHASGGIIHLTYSQQGEDQAPCVQFRTWDKRIDMPGALDEIRLAAKGRYSAKQRVVQPRAPKPLSNNMDDILQTAPHAEAGDDGGEDIDKAVAHFRAGRNG